ncbi:GHKL domain-containing protein [Patescibacteria group bacterium]|nr:GHKL domain-containing protein [Patescibacteria group bacterium]
MPLTPLEAIIIANAIAIFAIGWLALRHHWQTRQQTRSHQQRSRQKLYQNILFALTSFTCAAWLISDFLVDQSTNLTSALLWSKLTFVTSILILDLFFYFVILFPAIPTWWCNKYFLLIYALPTFLLVISPTNLLVKNVYFITEQTTAGWQIGFTPGTLYNLFITHQIIFLVATLAIIITKYHQSHNAQRLQLKYLALGFATTTAASIIFGAILPEIFDLPAWAKLAPASVIFIVTATAIALTKHYLLNIKIVAAEILAFFIGLTLLANILLATNKEELILRSLSFSIAVGISIWLVRSVRQEVARRQQIEQLAQKLEKANRKLATLNERKSVFVSMVAHELRTPLTSLQGYLTLLQSEKYGNVTSQQKAIFQKCGRNFRELDRFIDSLLDLAHIEAGQIKCIKKLFDLNELITKVATEMKASARTKNLRLVINQSNSLFLRADREKIKHVLINLIDNAIKYTDKGKITVSVRQRENHVIIEVKDTGSGLSPSECKQIFSKFTRTNGSWQINQQGLGLGLYIAKMFIDAHEGRIWVKSAGLNCGATFGFNLPCK